MKIKELIEKLEQKSSHQFLKAVSKPEFAFSLPKDFVRFLTFTAAFIIFPFLIPSGFINLRKCKIISFDTFSRDEKQNTYHCKE